MYLTCWYLINKLHCFNWLPILISIEYYVYLYNYVFLFGYLFIIFLFSVMWTELLMISAISCPLWSSVYECQRMECAFTSPVRAECGMFVMYCM